MTLRPVLIAMLGLLLFGQVSRSDNLQPLPQDVINLLGPRVRYQPVPLAHEDDAYSVLLQLNQKKTIDVPSSDKELDSLYSDVVDGTKPFPKGKDGEKFLAIIEANRDGLALFDQFATYRGIRFPTILDIQVDRLRTLSRIRRLQIAFHQAQGDFAPIKKWIRDLLHISQMLQNSEGGLTVWLIGSYLESANCGTIAHLASDPACPIELIEAWQQAALLLRTRPIESLAQVLRREFCEFFLPAMAKLPADATLGQAISAVADLTRPKKGHLLLAFRMMLREWQIRLFLFGHLAPFSRDETIQLASDHLAELLRVLAFDRSLPTVVIDEEDLDRLEERWPTCISLHAIDLMLLHLDRPIWSRWKEARDDIIELWNAENDLRYVNNVFGKYYIACYCSWVTQRDSITKIVVRNRVREEVTLTRMAIRRFERRFKRLPKSLHELVDEKYLLELPLDPVDCQPLRYDPNRQLLWSIGFDAQDDGGKANYWTDGGKFYAIFRKLLPSELATKLPMPMTPVKTPGVSDIVYSLDGSIVLPK